jgi:hypothetical protein
MQYPEDKVKKLLEELLAEAGMNRKVNVVVYRPDYMDYQVVMDGSHHSELRQKLFELIFTNNDPKGDAKREIKYLMQNAMEYEEWEKEDIIAKEGGGGGDDKMKIEDE